MQSVIILFIFARFGEMVSSTRKKRMQSMTAATAATSALLLLVLPFDISTQIQHRAIDVRFDVSIPQTYLPTLLSRNRMITSHAPALEQLNQPSTHYLTVFPGVGSIILSHRLRSMHYAFLLS